MIVLMMVMTFFFLNLLFQLKNDPENQKAYNLLELFAYGTYNDWKGLFVVFFLFAMTTIATTRCFFDMMY